MKRTKTAGNKGARAAKAAAPLSLVAHPPIEPFPHRCLAHLRAACARCSIPTGDAAFDIEPFV